MALPVGDNAFTAVEQLAQEPELHLSSEEKYIQSTRDDENREQRVSRYRERITSLRIELGRYEELLRLEEQTEAAQRYAMRVKRDDMLFDLEMKAKALDVASKERQDDKVMVGEQC